MATREPGSWLSQGTGRRTPKPGEKGVVPCKKKVRKEKEKGGGLTPPNPNPKPEIEPVGTVGFRV